MRFRIGQEVVLLVGLLVVASSMRAAEPCSFPCDERAARDAAVTQGTPAREVEPRPPQADDLDLLLWLDATDRATLTVDAQGYVSEWKSKATRLASSVHSAGTQRPQSVESAWESKPAVRFDGRDDVLRNTQFNQSAPQWTLFLVTCPRSNRGSGVPDGFHGFFSTTRPGQPDFVTGMNVDMGGYQTDRFVCLNVESTKGGGATNLLFVGTDFGQPRVLAVCSDLVQTTLFAESVGQATRSANDTTTSLQEIRIGSRSYLEARETGFVDADIAEVVLYARALPAEDIVAISRYLEQKYAVVQVTSAEPQHSLDEAVVALASYEWDRSRAALKPIDDVVRQGSVAERRALEERLTRVLRQGVSPAAADFTCRRLGIIGTSACVPVLASLLNDPERSAAARQALEQIPGPEAGQALLASLANADPTAYTALVQSLGARRERGAVEPLLAALQGDQPAKSEVAARALAEIGDPRAADPLLSSAAVSPHVLLTLAGNLAAAGHVLESLRVYEQLGKSEDRVVQAAVLRGLVTAEPSRAVERLLQALRGDDDRLRGQAVQLLAQQCSEQIMSAVWSEFSGLPVASQRVLLGVRWSPAPTMGRALAQRALQADAPEVREDGLRVLTDVGDASDVERIARCAVDDASPQVRDAAARALRHLAGDGTDEAVIRLLTTAPSEQRIVLIRAVRDRRTLGAESVLLQGAESSDQATRLESLGALEQLGDATSVPPLIARLLNSGTAEEQAAAERAIWRCALRCTGTVDPAAPVVAAYRSGRERDRVLLLPVLGRLGGPAASEILHAARADAQPALQAAAIRGLSNWPDATVADELLQVARQSDVPEHRLWALRGYIRVVAIPGARPADQTLSMLQDAWKLSTRDEERRLILQRLPAVVCVGSLDMAVGQLLERPLQHEARAAAAQLAESLLNSDPAAARLAIERILACDVDPALRVRLSRHLTSGQ